MRSRLAALALAVTACGNAHDLSLPSAPFTTLQGGVDIGAIAPKAAGHKILAGIVWGALPVLHPLCYENKTDPEIQKACPDPFGFFPGTVDATVELQPTGDGTITIPIEHLPSANVLIGDDKNHVAYASLLVVADLDDDGKISLVASRRGGGGGGGDGGGRPPLGGGTTTPTEPVVDQILAASFVTLKEDQFRISFREGDFKGLELFYPAPACGAPPAGFSLLKTNAYDDPSAQCTATDFTRPIATRPLEDDEATALSCRAQRMSPITAKPPDEAERIPKLSPSMVHCIGKELFLIESGTRCPTFQAMALKGCAGDPACKEPEWDYTQHVPEWWPCN